MATGWDQDSRPAQRIRSPDPGRIEPCILSIRRNVRPWIEIDRLGSSIAVDHREAKAQLLAMGDNIREDGVLVVGGIDYVLQFRLLSGSIYACDLFSAGPPAST